MIALETLQDLGWPQLVSELQRRCRSSRGAEVAAETKPLHDPSEAQFRSVLIFEVRGLDERAQPLSFAGISDVRDLVARASKGAALLAEELIAVATMGRGCGRLARQIREHSETAPHLAALAARFIDVDELTGTIFRCFDDKGELRDDASPALAPLRREVRRVRQRIDEKTRELLEDAEIAADLRDKFWTQRDERYVLPVKAEARSRVRGIVHGASQSGQTVFVEPEALVEINNQLKLAESALFSEQQRILAELSLSVGKAASALSQNGDVAAELDSLAAAASLAHDLAATPIVFEDDAIQLKEARHPLMVLSHRDCVANDLVVAAARVVVISGPNAGGKSVTLKTLGILVAMAQAGLHVPAAEGSVLPWFRDVRSAFGDAQSLDDELSTFSAHLLKLKNYVEVAGPGVLLLLDELCSATEPLHGAAMAQAFLETVSDRGASVFATTHYQALKTLAGQNPRFVNASVGFDMETMLPTFRLWMGNPGASFAFAMARRLGMPEDLVGRAVDLAGQGTVSMDALLVQLASDRAALERERAQVRDLNALAQQVLSRAEEREREARSKLRNAHESAHSQAVSSLREARRELDQVKVTIRKKQRNAALRTADRTIDNLASQVRGAAPPRPAAPGRPAQAQDIVSGAQVLVESLGALGTVVGTDNKNRVTVQVGVIKTVVVVSDLRILSAAERDELAHRGARPRDLVAASSRGVPESSATDFPSTTTAAQVDVRGHRVEEALTAVDVFVDEHIINGCDAVLIVHGHGTGALRAAIRRHLSDHPAVSEWRPGISSEGGDGVTVAKIG